MLTITIRDETTIMTVTIGDMIIEEGAIITTIRINTVQNLFMIERNPNYRNNRGGNYQEDGIELFLIDYLIDRRRGVGRYN